MAAASCWHCGRSSMQKGSKGTTVSYIAIQDSRAWQGQGPTSPLKPTVAQPVALPRSVCTVKPLTAMYYFSAGRGKAYSMLAGFDKPMGCPEGWLGSPSLSRPGHAIVTVTGSCTPSSGQQFFEMRRQCRAADEVHFVHPAHPRCRVACPRRCSSSHDDGSVPLALLLYNHGAVNDRMCRLLRV